jgi:pilus assembly protein CpaE
MTTVESASDNAQDAGAGLSVLLVDENTESRFAMRRSVQRAALDLVGESGYGTEAVSLALDGRPDVVLLAVEEPAARALDTAEAMSNALPETPIVVYSSLDDAESIRRSILVGARDYLVTPIEATRVAAAVRGALSNEERRQMRQAGQLAQVSGRGTVVTVAGAKGGVGKSVLSVNLAIALHRETHRSVLVIDADTHFGDVATLLDLHPEQTIAEVVAQRAELSRTNVRDLVTEHRSGVHVVAASEQEGAWDPCTIEDVERIIEAFAEIYDYVVIDTSGAVDRFVRTCIEKSTLTLIVSSGDVSSVRDTVAASRRLEGWGITADRVRYVMNSASDARGVPPRDLAFALGHELFWIVPHDDSVIESVQIGVPVLERGGSTAGDSITGLARRIAGREQGPITSGTGSFWRRLLRTRGGTDDAALAGAGERVGQR